jgi:colanic acid/amylovoran biosynthesis glycosyltransferase
VSRVAYLSSRYPAVTLSFIQREVLAVRRQGLEVDTYAIRRATPDAVLSAQDRREFEATSAVLPPDWLELLASHARAFLNAPRAYLGTLRRALALSPPGARGRLWQFFYFVEAMVLWRRLRSRGTRHVHVHFANVASDVALLVAHYGNHSGEGVPWSWSFTMHGPTEFYDVAAHRLGQKARDAAFVACIGDFSRSQLMALLPVDAWGKLHVVRCGVEVSVFDGRRTSVAHEAELRILNVAQLERRKGQAVLIEAIAQLADAGVPLRATIVGEGPERSALERLCEQLGVSDRVELVGAVGQDEIRAFYAHADVFCLPSFAEGVPVVLMEAMAMRMPVIATRIMGVPELVEDGVSGLLVAPGRSDELAAALRELAGSPPLRRRLGERGRQVVAERYDVEESARTLAALFTAHAGAGVSWRAT